MDICIIQNVYLDKVIFLQIKEASLKKIPERLKELPPFVTEFYNYHKVHSQPTTELTYLIEIQRFCEWLRTYTGTDYAQPLSSAKDDRHVTILDLSKLNTQDMNKYVYWLKTRRTFYGDLPTAGTINHSISALKAFFRYLCVESEMGTNNKPYLSYNPMLKIKSEKASETLNYRTQKISRQLFVGEEQSLLDFIEYDYEGMLSQRAKHYFNRDKVRDLAIIAVMLGSGVRVSELTGLDLKDVHIKQHKHMDGKIEYSAELDVIRKGNYKDKVIVVPWTVKYLANYLATRKDSYSPTDDQQAVFLTYSKGTGHRITTRAVQDLTKKYTVAYGRPSTPHKFRHTLGTELYKKNKNIVAVAQQLGQTSTSATDRYTHVGDEDLDQDMKYIGENTAGKYKNPHFDDLND